MTPTLFDLPLGLSDAAALADVVLDVCGDAPKPVSDEQRNRVAARLSATAFDRMRPAFASLERDPVHSAACYVCVDGVESQPLLLRVAPATTPSSGLFPKAILIGRTHLRSREVVLNAIPFGPLDHERIGVFAQQVNKAFLPKPAGSRPVILVRGHAPAATFPHAFTVFRRILKSTGLNQAAFGAHDGQDADDFAFATVWAAIRSGWREGYAMQGVKRRPFDCAPQNVARVVDLADGAAEDEIFGSVAPASVL